MWLGYGLGFSIEASSCYPVLITASALGQDVVLSNVSLGHLASAALLVCLPYHLHLVLFADQMQIDLREPYLR